MNMDFIRVSVRVYRDTLFVIVLSRKNFFSL